MSKEETPKSKKTNDSQTIRFNCTPTFYERAGKVSDKMGISRPELARYALQKEIENFEVVHGPIPDLPVQF